MASFSFTTGQSPAPPVPTCPQYRQSLEAAKLRAPVVDAISDIQEMWESGDFDVTAGDVARLAGRSPRSLEDLLARVGKVLGGAHSATRTQCTLVTS